MSNVADMIAQMKKQTPVSTALAPSGAAAPECPPGGELAKPDSMPQELWDKLKAVSVPPAGQAAPINPPEAVEGLKASAAADVPPEVSTEETPAKKTRKSKAKPPPPPTVDVAALVTEMQNMTSELVKLRSVHAASTDGVCKSIEAGAGAVAKAITDAMIAVAQVALGQR